MRTSSWLCKWRTAILRCAFVFLALTVAACAPASELTETDDFKDVAAAANKYADEFKPEHVLLVLDLDNTLMAMNSSLGSDQWFEWQKYLLDHEPNSRYAVANSFPGLLDAQGLLYNLGHMHPTQKDLPALMKGLQDRGIRAMVLTSRGSEFRVATERELRNNGYDFARTALAVRDNSNGTYEPYDPDHPETAGLTKAEYAGFRLGKPRPISYEHGIMMTAGQNKGAMLMTLLYKSTDDVEAIVYDDDSIRHVATVFAAVLNRGKKIMAFQYTREAANVQSFDYGSKKQVNRQWRKLSNVLEEVLQ